jgi:hypothetical protein
MNFQRDTDWPTKRHLAVDYGIAPLILSELP